ncbi:DUF1768-domain-containing protein [Canariomyces notabilis]|uniref:DUF1768-domain-containing protein n=1 Tax=Canariomyces notabilis TaxID=2074819 RepID=A0AAN6TM08_9PEZI|nr:DUF1768-domain-containing protein [Canariomyces arenarius]
MMYQKALLFNDRTVAAQILSASHPRQVKALGRKVSNFSDDVWHAHREEIVRRGNMLKFTRPVDEKDGKWEVVAAGAQDGTTGSKNLRELLLATGDREIVEASPMDRIWGIGFGAANAGKVGRERWGLNLLGRALMAVREELRGREGGEGKGEASVDGVEKEKTVLEKVDE